MSSTKEHWQHIYNTRDHKQVGWYQRSPEISLTLFKRIHAHPAQSVIDAGCGVSALVDRLIDSGYRNITLVDVSAAALAAVKARLGSAGEIPIYRAEDISCAQFNQCFDIWHDRAVFHFLTDAQDRKNYMASLSRKLSANGHAIIGTFALSGPSRCSGLDVVQYDDAKMKLELGENLELVESVISTHVTPAGTEQEYIYFIIKPKNA